MVHVGQHAVARPALPLGVEGPPAGFGRHRGERGAGGFQVGQRRFQRVQRGAAAGAPIAAEEGDLRGAGRKQCIAFDQPALGVRQQEVGEGLAHAERVRGGADPSPLADRHLPPLVRSADLVACAAYDPSEVRAGWREMWRPEGTRVVDIAAAANTFTSIRPGWTSCATSARSRARRRAAG